MTALNAQDSLKAGPISQAQFLAYAAAHGYMVQTIAEYQADSREIAIGNRAIDELLAYKAQSEADSVSLAALKAGILQLRKLNWDLENKTAAISADRQRLQAQVNSDADLLRSKDKMIWKLNDAAATKWFSVGIGPVAYYDFKSRNLKPAVAIGLLINIFQFSL